MTSSKSYICLRCGSPMTAIGPLTHPICCTPRVIVRPLIKIRPHPIAKKLRIAECNDKQIVVGEHYDEGVLGFFVPPNVIIPDKLLDEMWLKGKLSGKNKNMVQERSMAHVLSSGVFYGSRYYTYENGERVYHESPSWNTSWNDGDDVGGLLGLTPTVEEATGQKKKTAEWAKKTYTF